MKVMMNPAEIEFLLSYLNADDIMLEWGSGGSTLKFSQYVREYHSIEHNIDWYKRVKTKLPTGSTTFLYYVGADIPWTRNDPRRGDGRSFYEEYETYIKYVNVINKKFSKVLIDGRARQWCAEEVLKYLEKDAIVFIHDFGDDLGGPWLAPGQGDLRERKCYNTVLNHYSIIGINRSLVALKKI